MAAYGNRIMRSPGRAQRRQCRQGYPVGESAVTTAWSEAPAVASRRAASAISVRIGTIRKFEVFLEAAYAQSDQPLIDGIRAANSVASSKERRFPNRRGRLKWPFLEKTKTVTPDAFQSANLPSRSHFDKVLFRSPRLERPGVCLPAPNCGSAVAAKSCRPRAR